jgi:hypothetical protein
MKRERVPESTQVEKRTFFLLALLSKFFIVVPDFDSEALFN